MAKIPQFKSDEETAEFWNTHSLVDFEDELEEAKEVVFVRPQRQIVSIRLDRKYVEILKSLATEKGIGYSPLVRMWIVERIKQELENRNSP